MSEKEIPIRKVKVSKDITQLIDTYFDNDISSISKGRIKTIFNEGSISDSQQKELLRLFRYNEKSNRGEIKIQYKFETKEDNKDSKDSKEEDAAPDETIIDLNLAIEDMDDTEEYSPESPKSDNLPEDEIKESRYIIPHRKAFVDFINKGFYKQILRKTQEQSGSLQLNVYQVLIKEYLSIETPYRGLLVYHGLGTGKTASAVSMAEKASSDMKIRTLLPASLESNFVGEVKQWGKGELDMEGQLWSFYSIETIEKTPKVRKKLMKQYQVSIDIIKQIFNHFIREVKVSIKKNLIDKEPALLDNTVELKRKITKEFKTIESKVKQSHGFWFHEGLTPYKELSVYDKLFLECQIHRLVQIKYNFIHYNPFPSFKKSDTTKDDTIDDIDDIDELEDTVLIKQNNERIKQELLKLLRYNIKHRNIESPFYNETIIIDEVHNFVREILNNSGSARLFYEWIVNAQNVKLVFLSGTPIINKPSEIAVLYNMLQGRISIYRFTIQSNRDPVEITTELNKIIYSKQSSIELFHVSRKQGKLIISFTKHQNHFVSVMNPENQQIYTSSENNTTYERFIKDIFQDLTKIFDIKDILPSKQDALKTDLDELVVYDALLNIPYHKQQTLFEINKDNQSVDLSNNESFMEYFFTESYDIEDKKKTLLRRMLMGLTSYYPIDRSKIGSMPTLQPPIRTKQYENYSISESMNVELCVMSQLQFSKYIEAWRQQKKKDLVRQMRRHLHDEQPFDFNIRTRQICNMIYKDDEFRYIRDKDRAYSEKMKQYENLRQTKTLDITNQLSEYSPKMYRIMQNIMKYRQDTKPTGKILIYSDFRGDSGGELIEQVLLVNGYTKYNPSEPSSNTLKFTFITGEEGVDQRKQNMKAFNESSNNRGEQIQIMIISGAGAEGISLTCVRQVHILEPYWNFVRIEQVFGRAIRLYSHDELDLQDRTVEEYLYLSVLPSGSSIDEIYKSIQSWDTVPEITNLKQDITQGKYKDLKDTLDMITTIGITEDQKIFDIMERKYKVSQSIIEIIKQSSLDCIQHTRDEPQLNDQCIRFSNQLLHEIAYFPGISASELFEIDQTQLNATFLVFVKPNHYVVSGGENRYIYYETKETSESDIDARYIRENSTKVGEINLDEMNIYLFVDKDHPLQGDLGKQFSVYQDIISIEPYYESILDKQFPTIKTLHTSKKDGYKIKYNKNEMMFYSPNTENSLRRLYRFENYLQKELVKPLLLCNQVVYIQD